MLGFRFSRFPISVRLLTRSPSLSSFDLVATADWESFVAYKLLKRKLDETLKVFHTILFGRRGKLNPPASEVQRLMHKLAADPGIVAIMNKHRWRVGIMMEMAPEVKAGVSPVCILGLNKNMGEEISLRLRTDDLKGFRKYAVITKTLVHELAHMVYS